MSTMRAYTREFRESAVSLVLSAGLSIRKAAADINADELVDGIDLASVLGSWGSAPRVPFPPTDCPLDLVNP